MPEILNIREAAKLTRLSAGTLYIYVERRKIPFLKIGSRVLFEREALETWLAEHRVPAFDSRRSSVLDAR